MSNEPIGIKKSILFLLYVLGFIFAFVSAIPAYINSSFIESITNENAVGIIYTLGSIITLLFFVIISRLLKKYGSYKVTICLTFFHLINFLCLAFVPQHSFVIFSFMLSSAIGTMIYFNFDIFVEHYSANVVTGRIRSVYLTCINLAWLLSPWLAGLIVGKTEYRNVYFVVAMIMIPIIMLISLYLKDFKDPDYKTFDVISTLKSFGLNKNIKDILWSSVLLQLFYSWMIIYTPIYLNRYLGFDWESIGIIFSIMLLPFVFIQIPLGYLADKKYGEKEILSIGFVIMGISTAIIPLIHSHSAIVWGIILFITRIGAAMVEVMNDTYFFKKVNDKNLNLINLYRAATPMTYVISPIIATILIVSFPIQVIFYVLGSIMILGLRFSLAIEDTK